MKALILHPTMGFVGNNPGDFLTFLGGRSLLRKLFPDIQLIYFDWGRDRLDVGSYLNILNYGDIDIVVVIGLPVFSSTSTGYLIDVLPKVRDKYTMAKFIALGIGQSYSLPILSFSDYISMSYVEHLRGFDLIITRDFLAHSILRDNDVHNIYFYDMSVFAYGILDQWADKQASVRDPLSVFLHYPGHYLADYILKVELDFIHNYNPLVVTNDISGKDVYKELYGLDVVVVNELDYLARLYSRADNMLTTRVHQSILGLLMGARPSCIAIDARYLTLCPFEIDIISADKVSLWIPETELPKFSLLDLVDGVYLNQMRGYFSDVSII